MTREEIVKSMSLQDAIQVFKDTNCYGTMDIAKSVILKALEQEPILDKIRAEIEKEIIPRNSDQYDHEAMWQNCGLRMALKAIDKYKAESEDKE